MGLLISRFRKKKNSEELLEDLTKKIEKIEKCQETEQVTLKVRNQQFIIYTTLFYIFLLCSCYILKLFTNNHIKMLLLLYPLIIYFLRKGLIYYYKRKLTRNKSKIETYKTEKQKILNDVMETETYKIAKRILEKYDTNNFSKFVQPKMSTPIPIPKGTPLNTPIQNTILQTDLRKRSSRDVFFHGNNMLVSAKKPPPSLIRPIIQQNKGVIDRLFQKVIGDGPNERYALICRGCGSHNGMALQEEFEYLAYRCAFCSYYNPARKQRPSFTNPFINALAIEGRQSSDSEDTTNENTVEIKEIFDSEDEKDSEKKSVKDEEQIEGIVEIDKTDSGNENNSTEGNLNLENDLNRDKSNVNNGLIEEKPNVDSNTENYSTKEKHNVENTSTEIDKQTPVSEESIEKTDSNLKNGNNIKSATSTLNDELTEIEKLNSNYQEVFIVNNNQSDLITNSNKDVSNEHQVTEFSESNQPVLPMEVDEDSGVTSVLTNRVSQMSIQS